MVKSAIEIKLRMSFYFPLNSAAITPIDQKHLIDPIGLHQPNVDPLTFRDIDIFSDDIGANWQFA